MVRRATLIFGSSILFTVGLVYYIHYAQQQEIFELKKGVERDLERRKYKQMQKEKRLNEEQVAGQSSL